MRGGLISYIFVTVTDDLWQLEPMDMERRNPRAPPLSIKMHFGSGNLVGEIVLRVNNIRLITSS